MDKSIEDLVQAVRGEEKRKAELCSLLSDIKECFTNLETVLVSLDTRHLERDKQLAWVEKICAGIYNQLQTLITILAKEVNSELSESDELRKELERRGLERDSLSLTASRDMHIGVDGDIIGGDKDENKKR